MLPEGTNSSRNIRRAVVSLIACLVLVTVGTIVLRYYSTAERYKQPRAASREFAALIAAVNAESTRPTVARLTGGFSYRPAADAVRGSELRPNSLNVAIAAAAVEKTALLPHASLDYLAGLGAAYLVQQQSGQAVAVLEEAQDRSPSDPRILSDLAAAYITSGEVNHQPEQIARGLDASERAIRAERDKTHSLLEARFNRALALERLYLVAQAQTQWRAYIEAESSPEWEAEAGHRLAALTTASVEPAAFDRSTVNDVADHRELRAVIGIVRSAPHEARAYVERELFLQWAQVWPQANWQEAAKLLDRTRILAEALFEVTGDRLAKDTVESIDRCVRQTSSRCGSLLAQGIQALHDGRRLSDQFNFAGAVVPLRQAVAALGRARSPLVHWATFHAAITTYHARNLDLAASQFATLERAVSTEQYLSLLGRIASLRGLIEADRGAFDNAARHYQRALSYLERTNDVENEATAANLLADNLRVLGDFGAAWNVRLSTLGSLRRLSPQRRLALLLATARLAEAQRLFGASLHFQNAALAIALSSEGPAARAQVLVRRAATHQELGDVIQAREDVGQVRNWLGAITDPSIKARLEAELLVVEATVASGEHHTEAVSRALEFSHRAGLVNYLPRLYHLKGRKLLQQGHSDEAAASFEQGIVAFEEGRMRTATDRSKISYFDRAWDLFADMVALQVRAGNSERAFEYAERGRSRMLQDALLTSGQSRAALGTLVSALPTSTGLIYYVLLDDAALVWTITNSRTAFARHPLSRSSLRQQVRRFKQTLQAGTGTDADAEALFDVLLRPSLPVLQGVKRLVIVPDGELNAVPFAALRCRETGRYLVEDYVIAWSPSATLWTQPAPSRHSWERQPTVTVISASKGRGAGLADLPGAAAEATDVAALYPRSRLLADTATKTDFINALRSEGVVHFAGHAIANMEFPELSRIVLGDRNDADSGFLYGHEIGRHRDLRSELVVLSACSTAAGLLSRGEGPISLARPLLVGGVNAVVASLWDVSDTASREVSVRFHRAFRNGEDVFAALRNAQLSLIASRHPEWSRPGNWAAFAGFGRSSHPIGSRHQESH